MAEPDARPGFPWLLTLMILPALALLIGLGIWQTERLVWKEDRIARAEAAAALAPRPIAEVLASPDPEFRKALALCRGLPSAPYVELVSIQDGSPGVRLISACRPEGTEQTFLVDRGFVAESISARPPVMASTLPLSLTVELRRTPEPGGLTPEPEAKRFYGRDNAAMARVLGAGAPSEFTLYALTSPNPEWEALIAGAPPAAFSNNHLGYAITWFGLALALAGVYAAMLIRRLRVRP